MRLVIWNCNMALHRKYQGLMRLKPDIAVIPECAASDILQRKASGFEPTDMQWVGKSPNKGLGVFAFNGHKLSVSRDYDSALRHVLSLHVSGPSTFDLLAVWAFMSRDQMRDRYDPGPVMRASYQYEAMLASGRTILAGDFNNHVKWDKRGNPRNFRSFTDRLDSLGLASAYHATQDVELGGEPHHTHYWRDRKEHSPHNCHIDYIFAPKPWLEKCLDFSIGSYGGWCDNGLSDHVPLAADFRI